MYVLNITDEYDSFLDCTDNENDDISVIVKYLLLSIPESNYYLLLV